MSITIPTFYKRYEVKNAKNLKVKGPVILTLNHPNAIVDPLTFSLIVWPPKTMYMARGDAFKPGFATYFLDSVGIVPIYRIQDAGKDGLKKNDESYARVNELLKRNTKIMIFAEGICVWEKRLRPLKKGVSRMVFNSFETINKPDLVVLPVGVNYSNSKKFRSNLFYNIGEPIKVIDYIERYRAEPARTLNTFLRELEDKMRLLTIHVANPLNDILYDQLEELLKRDWCKKQNLNYKNLEQDFIVGKQIAEMINRADVESLTPLKDKCKIYFDELNKNNIRDWLINPANIKKTSSLNLFFRFFILCATLPLYIIGLIGNYLPYRLAKKLADKTAKTVEFHASVSLSAGSFLFLFNYILLFFIVFCFLPLGPTLLVIALFLFTGWFSLYYHPFKQKTFGMSRIVKNTTMTEELRKKRQEIMDLVATINTI